MFVCVFFWLLCVVIIASIAKADQISSWDIIDQKLKEWKQLSTSLVDKNRNVYIKPVLQYARGIYRHGSIQDNELFRNRLKDTVLVTVFETQHNTEKQYTKYTKFLKNFVCYGKRFGYKTVVYAIMPPNDRNTTIPKLENELRLIDNNVRVLSYPYSSFWRYVSTKQTIIQKGSGKASYEGNVPSFRHFGTLPKLIPIMEALQLGVSILYLDIDIAFFEDPIPFMLQGSADFVVATELRSCRYDLFYEYLMLHCDNIACDNILIDCYNVVVMIILYLACENLTPIFIIMITIPIIIIITIIIIIFTIIAIIIAIVIIIDISVLIHGVI